MQIGQRNREILDQKSFFRSVSMIVFFSKTCTSSLIRTSTCFRNRTSMKNEWFCRQFTAHHHRISLFRKKNPIAWGRSDPKKSARARCFLRMCVPKKRSPWDWHVPSSSRTFQKEHNLESKQSVVDLGEWLNAQWWWSDCGRILCGETAKLWWEWFAKTSRVEWRIRYYAFGWRVVESASCSCFSEHERVAGVLRENHNVQSSALVRLVVEATLVARSLDVS